MKKINWEPIGKFVGQVCEVALYGVALVASYKVGKIVTNGLETTSAGYKDAVGAIMDSGMFSHDKREAVEALNRYESAEYYGAIVRIANDATMFSHDKVKMIIRLSEN